MREGLFVLIKAEFFKNNDKEKEYRQGWDKRKRENLKLSRSYKALKWIELANRVSTCADTLVYKVFEDGTKKLDRVYFCKNKVCPICNRRRAVKHRLRAEKVFAEVMKLHPNAKYLFVTFTVKNVAPDQLGQTMTLLTKSYNKMMKRVRVSKNLLGTIRATEITRNEKTEEYHPHIHAVFMVKSSYFTGASYITQKEWSKIWGDCLGVAYTPVVDIRRIKAKDEDLKGAIVEAIKYPIKMAEIDLDDTKVVNELREGTYRKRQLAYTGLLKEIDKNFRDTKEVETELEQETEILVARWNPDKQVYGWSDED